MQKPIFSHCRFYCTTCTGIFVLQQKKNIKLPHDFIVGTSHGYFAKGFLRCSTKKHTQKQTHKHMTLKVLKYFMTISRQFCLSIVCHTQFDTMERTQRGKNFTQFLLPILCAVKVSFKAHRKFSKRQ